MLPGVKTTEADGGLGINPPTTGGMMAIVGPAPAGPSATPSAFARVADIETTYSNGPTVEAAAYAIERYGRPIIFVRTGATNVGTYGAVTFTGTGTSVPTTAAGTFPDDDYEAYLIVKDPGTIGVAGITIQWSLDNGRTLSPKTALGTATFFIFPNSGGARVNFAAGTLVAGDTVAVRCGAPNWNATELDTALTALQASALNWEFFQIVGALDATAAATASARLTAMHNAAKHKWGHGHFRMPNAGESDAAYQAAFGTAFSSFSDTSLVIAAAAAKVLSSRSRRQYRRPPSFASAALASSVFDEIDLAMLDLGVLPGVQIRDANGNVDEHDEAINPGLDDLRALSLRTFDDTGVYITNPRVMAPAGSDFIFLQFRRVMNIARQVVRNYFKRRLSKIVRVDAKTGFILEQEAANMDAEVTAALRQEILTKPKASALSFVLSRNDAILTPPFPMSGDLRMVPLGYPKTITLRVSWNNPSIRTQV